MAICRKIWAESFEKIDFQNIGNHWTVEGNEAYIAMSESIELNGVDLSHLPHFWLYVDSGYGVNEAATEISNREYPDEKEVVLSCNQDIVVSEVYGEGMVLIASNVPVNTGGRVDQWVNAV